MGRYYGGQISGKFWFGIQSSCDATEFGCEPANIVNYSVCNCVADDIIIDTDNDTNNSTDDGNACNEEIYKNKYCNGCFASLEEHLTAIEEEGNNDDDPVVKTWFVSETEVDYQFEGRHIASLDNKIAELEELVGKYIIEYNIKDEDHEITYDCITIEKLGKDELEMVARLCLGRQISYCLHNKGSCYFYAEL